MQFWFWWRFESQEHYSCQISFFKVGRYLHLNITNFYPIVFCPKITSTTHDSWSSLGYDLRIVKISASWLTIMRRFIISADLKGVKEPADLKTRSNHNHVNMLETEVFSGVSSEQGLKSSHSTDSWSVAGLFIHKQESPNSNI